MGSEAEIRVRIERTSSSALCDARGKQGALDSSIRLLSGSRTLAGPAVTADCEEGSASALLRALAEAGPGDVLCIRGPGEWAYFGELVGAEAVRRNLAGVIVDGLVRDLPRLATLDLPLYARGTTPRGARPGGGGEVGGVVEIGGVEIVAGDWIVGDADGVVTVPAGELEQVLARADGITAIEDAAWERVLAGASLFDEESQYGAPLGERMGER